MDGPTTKGRRSRPVPEATDDGDILGEGHGHLWAPVFLLLLLLVTLSCPSRPTFVLSFYLTPSLL